jgi:putative tryptophan/tyrosine transport system substrate-binding protein
MRRREFILGVSGLVTWPVVAQAQQIGRVRRIGILMPFPRSDAEFQTRVQVFRQELVRLGWSEGSNVQFDERWSTDNMDLVRADAAALLALNPDVILTSSDRVIRIFTTLTSSVPIVVVLVLDPVASGAVESLATPGGNVTGFSVVESSILGKMLETLKQIVPSVSRVGMVHNPDNPVGAIFMRLFETSAMDLAIHPIDLPIHNLADVENAVASMAKQPNGGILFPPDATIFLHRAQILALVARHRVPAIYSGAPYTAAGGLASYGPDTVALFRQSAGYVDRILRGEKAAELPFQQPTTYRFVLNLKTANALGITVPASVLTRADEVIE